MKLGIRGRITLVVGLLLMLFYVTSVVAYVLTKRIGDDLSRLAYVDDLGNGVVNDMEFQVSEVAGALLAYMVDGKAADRERVHRTAAAFDLSATTYMSLATTPEQVRLGEEVIAAFERIGALAADLLAVTDVDGSSSASSDRKLELLTEFRSQRGRLDELLVTQIVPRVRAARVSIQESARFTNNTITLYIVAMTILGALIGSGGGLLLVRHVVHPILELRAGIDAIASGGGARSIAVESDDEIGELADSMIRMARMAETREQTEQVLREMAHHDALTKLPNRTLFQIRLVEAMENAGRVDRMVALHLLDLDRFKDVNDTLGHRAGDMLLQQIAGRLRQCLRKSDTVARLGGDEFAIIQTNLTDEIDITALAERLSDTLAEPFDLDGERVYTGASVGVTVFPNDDREVDVLLRNADLALYRAKQEGGGGFQLFDSDMNAELQARKALEHDLRVGLERGEFFVQYQPQMDLSSGRIVGAEALSRWRHPERGLIAPDDFIPAAEKSGLIGRLTERVLRDACANAKDWKDAGLSELRVSVNLSPIDFKRNDIVSLITGIVEESGIDPAMLELEITEGMVMSDADSVIATLDELHALGVQLAIDDFGTGFSSMSYLKRFPIDRLKIDQTFVRDMLANREDASIARVIILLAHSLGLKVVAEGVEDEAQLEFLERRNCDEAQGYHIGAPLDADAFVEFVVNHAPLNPVRAARIA